MLFRSRPATRRAREPAFKLRVGSAPDLVARVLKVVDDALAELARAVAHNVEQPVRLVARDLLEALVILADRRVVLVAWQVARVGQVRAQLALVVSSFLQRPVLNSEPRILARVLSPPRTDTAIDVCGGGSDRRRK